MKARVPEPLGRILEQFETLPDALKRGLLLEYAERMPEAEGVELEPVEECQTPFAIEVTLDESGRVRLAFRAPASSPTVRAFGGILAEGLGGLTPEEVLAVPDEVFRGTALEALLTPRRTNGLEAALRRIKEKVRSLNAPER